MININNMISLLLLKMIGNSVETYEGCSKVLQIDIHKIHKALEFDFI